jgi:hypothetical protein
VHDRIVCVSLESDLAVMSRDPLIKGVMQKQVGQQRGDDAPLRRTFVPVRTFALLILGRSFQPPLNVELHPRFPGMLSHSLQAMIFSIRGK